MNYLRALLTVSPRTVWINTFALPLAALFIYLAAPPSVNADCKTSSCEYAGSCYSTGARIQSTCGQGKGQICSSGVWGSCAAC